MLAILTLLLLMIIALELGWIIFKTLKSESQSQKSISDAVERVIKGQEGWTEITRDLATKLANPPEGETLLGTSDTNGLRQLQVQTAQMLTVLQDLSVSVSKAQNIQTSSSVELSDRITELLEQTCSRMDKSVTQVTTELRSDREQSLKILKSQSNSQRDELKTLTSLLLEALSEVGSPAKAIPSRQLLQDEQSPNVPRSFKSVSPPVISPISANDHVVANKKASVPASNFPPAVSGDSGSGSLEFETLQSWVNVNLPQIMNRSLNQWNKPEELFRGAPCQKGYTARLLDPDSKLVLAGVNDTSQYLVIALPGGYIDPRYYEWFNLPKGIGPRVERTMTPAIVETTDLGFRVLQRGLITQD